MCQLTNNKKIISFIASSLTFFCHFNNTISASQVNEDNCITFTNKISTPSFEGLQLCTITPLIIDNSTLELFNSTSQINNTIPKSEHCCFVYIPKDKSPNEKKRLSFYWAQELIGADLLREEMDQELKEQSKSHPNLIAIIDGNNNKKFLGHGDVVHNLISHTERQAVLPQLNKKSITLFFDRDFPSTLSEIQGPDHNPSFINISLGLDAYASNTENDTQNTDESTIYVPGSLKKAILESISKISETSTIVFSGGNITNPKEQMINLIKWHSAKFRAVLVGNLSIRGKLHDTSRRGSPLSILAPSDVEVLTSINKEGEYVQFGGTSGAAPLVTGSLGAFQLISGYRPTPEEVKHLIQKTSIPSSASTPSGTRLGIINTYKIGTVAKELKQICDKIENSVEKKTCFETHIKGEKIYKFESNQTIYEEFKKSFPECNNQNTPHPSSSIFNCSEKKKTLRKIRKAVLLNPFDTKLWEALSCIYKEQGDFTDNAKLFEAIQNSAQEILDERNNPS